MDKLGVYGLSPATIPNEVFFLFLFFQEFYGPIVYVSISLADQKLGLGARLAFLLSALLQVSLWSNNYLKAASGDPLPEMQRLMDWLPHHTPHSNLQSEAHTYTKDVVQIEL